MLIKRVLSNAAQFMCRYGDAGAVPMACSNCQALVRVMLLDHQVAFSVAGRLLMFLKGCA